MASQVFQLWPILRTIDCGRTLWSPGKLGTLPGPYPFVSNSKYVYLSISIIDVALSLSNYFMYTELLEALTACSVL